MRLFAQSGWVTGLMLGALGVVIGWLLLRTHRHLSRQKTSDSPLVRVPRPEQTEPGHHLDAPPELLRWEVQMHETARALSAQLDSKMSALRCLIAEADRAAARLEASQRRDISDVPPRHPEDVEMPSRAMGGSGICAHPPSPAGRASSPDGIGQPTPRDPQPTTQAEALRPPVATDRAARERDEVSTRPSPERRQEEIYTLADYGLDAAEIARRVGSPVGEVQLILGLREKN
jgi:hypothetical protein